MEEKKIGLLARLKERKAEKRARLAEIKYNSGEAVLEREIGEIERQEREEAAKGIRKELVNVEKKTAKASKEVDKFAKKRVDLVMAGDKWKKDKEHAWAVVASLTAKASALTAELKKLELVDAPKEKSLKRTYENGSSSLWSGKDKKKTDEEEESITVDLKTYKQKK